MVIAQDEREVHKIQYQFLSADDMSLAYSNEMIQNKENISTRMRYNLQKNVSAK